MKKEPLISIITVVYNDAGHILTTIDSVREQTYDAIEHIIVDGASTDGTMDVVNRFDDTLKVISEPDRGIYDAMNKGLRMATGEYIWFLNAGDRVYERDTVEKMISLMHNSPDVVYGGTMIIDEHGRAIGDRRLKPPARLSWKSFRQGMIVCHQALVVRRALAEKYDPGYRIAGDIDWAIRCTRKADTILNSGLVLCSFMEGGLSGTYIRQGLKERFRIMRRFYGLIPTLLRHFVFGVRLTNFYLRHRRI
jgi:glycosyltransferase involved in cell wall biosynthesis